MHKKTTAVKDKTVPNIKTLGKIFLRKSRSSFEDKEENAVGDTMHTKNNIAPIRLDITKVAI